MERVKEKMELGINGKSRGKMEWGINGKNRGENGMGD